MISVYWWTLNIDLVAIWCITYYVPRVFAYFLLAPFFSHSNYFMDEFFSTVFTHSRVIRFSAFCLSLFLLSDTCSTVHIVSITMCVWNCVNERRITYGFSDSDGTRQWYNSFTDLSVRTASFFVLSSTGSSIAQNYSY